MAQSDSPVFQNQDTVAVRQAEVPDASFDNGMNLTSVSGIGISTENPNLEQALFPPGDVTSGVGSWSLENRYGLTRVPQYAQHIGGDGSDTGDAGATGAFPIGLVAPENVNADGSVTDPEQAVLETLEAGWEARSAVTPPPDPDPPAGYTEIWRWEGVSDGAIAGVDPSWVTEDGDFYTAIVNPNPTGLAFPVFTFEVGGGIISNAETYYVMYEFGPSYRGDDVSGLQADVTGHFGRYGETDNRGVVFSGTWNDLSETDFTVIEGSASPVGLPVSDAIAWQMFRFGGNGVLRIRKIRLFQQDP